MAEPAKPGALSRWFDRRGWSDLIIEWGALLGFTDGFVCGGSGGIEKWGKLYDMVQWMELL
mgnify:CR=1 FL=1